jgi:hypothetical protein
MKGLEILLAQEEPARSDKMWNMKRGHVPIEPIARRVRDRLNSFPEQDDRHEYRRYLESVLRFRDDGQLHSMFLHPTRKSIPFHLADCVLVSLGDPSEWHAPDLIEHYLSCDIDCLGAYFQNTEDWNKKRNQTIRKCKKLRAEGKSWGEISKTLRINKETVRKYAAL